MFNETEKTAYRAVKAPEELRERVLSMADTVPTARRRPVRRFVSGAVAACLVLAVLLSALLPRGGVTLSAGEIAVSGTGEGVMLARAAGPLSLPVTVKTHGQTILSVSHGTLRRSDTGAAVSELNDSAELLWELDAPEETERYTLSADCGKSHAALILAFDAGEGRWTVAPAEE